MILREQRNVIVVPDERYEPLVRFARSLSGQRGFQIQRAVSRYMGRFDFISGTDFRASLESDYRELNVAKEHAAWKAVHVLAGSIIEAVLVDYLNAIDFQGRTHKDPTKMSLGDLVSACKDEGILSQRCADLSSVVREYRNLIHPGRVVRLGETVDQNGATVAAALVEIIIDEIEGTKKATYGSTAEQIVAKIEQDSSVTGVFEHLLKDIKTSELERLLSSALPNSYFEHLSIMEDSYGHEIDAALANMAALAACFRRSFEYAPDDIKRRVVQNFVKVIKEEAKRRVFAYEVNLFSPADISYLDLGDASLVKQHLLSRFETDKDLSLDDYYSLIDGLGEHLDESECSDFVDAAMQKLNRYVGSETEVKFINAVAAECLCVQQDGMAIIIRRLDTWVKFFDSRGQELEARIARKLHSQLEIDPGDVPF